MKSLNVAAALVLTVTFALLLRSPPHPPDDPWFLRTVAEQQRPVLVKFGADWCPPCRHVDGVLDRAEGHLPGGVKIVRIDIGERPELAQHYGISRIPRLLLFQKGQVIASHGGFADVDRLEDWLVRSLP